MSSEMRWRTFVKDLETMVRIGIHNHEQEPQKILVNVSVEGTYTAYPQTINECFNYDLIHHLAVTEWPGRPHTQLLETMVLEMLNYIFHMDERVDYASVSISKPDIFKQAAAVGVEAEWYRNDFNRINGISPS